MNTQPPVCVARRDGNTKRPYLLVNPLQGKHVPVSPSTALSLFAKLTAQIQSHIPAQEPVLVIAFAETATAIGAAVATQLQNPTFWLHTTRESVEHTDYLYFSETHSHATEQRLCTHGLACVLSQVRHVVFVEDEITTGNTIFHLLDVLQKQFSTQHLTFGIASLLNGMTPEAHARFAQSNIWVAYLHATDNTVLANTLSRYACDGPCYPITSPITASGAACDTYPFSQNPRLVGAASDYQTACLAFARQIHSTSQRILVLGTEECMYPGLLVAKQLETQGNFVRFHATTRSPILPSTEDTYPLHCRFTLASLYDMHRVTYLYNLDAYDIVFVITDSPLISAGLQSLLGALEQAGNQNITIWRLES